MYNGSTYGAQEAFTDPGIIATVSDMKQHRMIAVTVASLVVFALSQGPTSDSTVYEPQRLIANIRSTPPGLTQHHWTILLFNLICKQKRSLNDDTVDDVVALLSDERAEEKRWIAQSLGCIGHRADAALPELERLLKIEQSKPYSETSRFTPDTSWSYVLAHTITKIRRSKIGRPKS